MPEILVNADDFGATNGVTTAIVQAHKEGIVNSTSLMVTMPYAVNAAKQALGLPALKVGLHLNLTNGESAADAVEIPLLTDKNGRFKNGFLMLLILSFLRPFAFRRQVGVEVVAQLAAMKKTGLSVAHIDGHRHVQMVPAVFKIVQQQAVENNIPRLRFINESLVNTVLCNKGDCGFLFDGGLVKYVVLRVLGMLIPYRTDTYFYSVLYTGKLFKNRVKSLKVPSKYARAELMIHPGRPDIDRLTPDDVFDAYVLSGDRQSELETALDKTLLEGVK